MKIHDARILASVAIALVLALGGAQAALPPPDQSIRQTTDKLQALIRQHHAEYKADPNKFYAMADAVIVPRFDQKAIGQLVLGRNWRTATDGQRIRFIAAFKNSLVHSYADALLEYHDTVKTEWKPARVAPEATDATVNVNLLRQSGPPIPIGFAVHQVNDDWKVYDVAIEGVSLASSFRSQFNAEIKKNGLDALIQRLESGGKPLQQNPVKQGSKG